MTKKLFIFAIAELILTAIFFTVYAPKNRASYSQADDIVRIRIVANSNKEEDLNVKSSVKELLTDFFTERSPVGSKETMQVVSDEKDALQKGIDDLLDENGFDYGAELFVGKEDFPVRLYDDILTESGSYNTVEVILGDGKGDNWWCVAYPSLCLNKQKQKVTFKSRIANWFNKLFG